MILEVFSGIFVSIVAIISFLLIQYIESVNRWILITSKFIYFSGHPLLNEDQIYDQITKIFKLVFVSLTIVIFKTILFLIIILASIAFFSFLVLIIRGISLSSLNSTEFLSFLFPNYLFKFSFILGTLLPMFLIPIIIKDKKKEKVTYSSIDQFLHYVFLGNKNIAKFLFSIELYFNKKILKRKDSYQSVYISGLARAGTTVLMQYLGQLTEFKSLSYKNLPFLFLPKTGLHLISKKKNQKIERFHKDGIKHGINSYEALEEPFWRNYIGHKYILDKNIIKHSISPELFDKYISFRKLVTGNKIYLAKNNNHLLRAESLHQLDKVNGNKTITIIPFRNPYEQAKSLLKQHLLLSELQKDDEFILNYMDFLVHHEFGIHTKIPILNIKKISTISDTKDTFDHWLEVWYLYYNEILKQFSNKENFYFFCYNTFVENPYNSLASIVKVLDLPINRMDSISIKEFKSKNVFEANTIKNKYLEIYNKLNSIAINNENG